MKKFYLLFFIAILLFVTYFLIINIFDFSSIKLIGDSKVYVLYNKSYKDLGYKISNKSFFKKYKVKINDNVDTKKLGKYTISYEYNGKKINREVNVIDYEKPIIKLNGSVKTYVCDYDNYIEEGFSVSDNYDDLSLDDVKVKKNTNSIYYTVSDLSGNETTVIRRLIKKDNEAPSIDINLEDVTIYKGTNFLDTTKASDNCDKDIELKTFGEVDVNTVGEYFIKYIAEDSSNNKSIAKRKVTVVDYPETRDKVIYLTFDDGPSFTVTPKVLEILDKYNIKATFFVNNTDAIDLIKDEYYKGNTVGMHGASHRYQDVYNSLESCVNNYTSLENLIVSKLGYSSKLMRFIGGSSNTISRNYKLGVMTSCAGAVNQMGYKYFDWNVDSGDAEFSTSSEVLQRLKSTLKEGSNVVLLHDRYGNEKILDILPEFIEYATSLGYSFAPLNENSPVMHHNIQN